MYRTKDTYDTPKYSGRSKAKVIDNRDPLNRGRIQVDHPILGKTTWIDYLTTPHQFDVPSIGDIVYVECDTGEYEFPVAWGNVTKGLDENVAIPQAFKRNVPSNRGSYTPGGHLVELDDGESNPTNSPVDTNLTSKKRGIRITSSANNKIHILEDTVNGNQYILLQDAGGNLIKLDYSNNKLTINSIGTTEITTAGAKTESVGATDSLNVAGNKSETIGGNLTIQVTGNVNIQCAAANITSSGETTVTASTIKLNGDAGDVLTTQTDPYVDTIFGVPTIGVTTVKSG